MLEQLERRCIKPLQIVEEQCERTRLWKAWPTVAYGMSRLYWSNLPDANSPRGGTSALCSSFTTEDLPMPEYPDTSTSSGVPFATTRSKQAIRVSISRS